MGKTVKSVVGAAAPAIGTALGGPIGGAIGSAVGGAIAGRDIGQAVTAGGNQYAQQMSRLGQQGYFRPVGVTTRFGQSQFEVDPTTGALKSAGYTASPEVLARQAQLGGLMETSLGQAERAAALQPQYEQAAQGLFGLGQSYLAQTPEEARQRYMQQQMDVLRPYDIEEEQRLAAGVFGRGRGGLSVGAGGQPELQALAESRARRNLQLAAGAEQAAQQQIGFGAGLFGTGAGVLSSGYQTQAGALAPFQQQFQTQQALETAAQQPLQLGATLGQAAMGGGQFAAGLGAQGALGQLQAGQASEAARYNIMRGLMESPTVQQGTQQGLGMLGALGSKVGGYFGGLFGRGSSSPALQSQFKYAGSTLPDPRYNTIQFGQST